GPALCLSPDGRHLLSAYTNQTFSVWETINLREGARFRLPFTNTATAALAPGGAMAVFSSATGEMSLWESATGQFKSFGRPETDRIQRLAFSSDGQRVVSASGDTVRVWDVFKQKELEKFPTEGDFLMSLVFFANGNVLMAGSDEGSVRCW